ncbi:aldo/keto reductase [Pyrobaculum neutrophilum]|uniref:Aldo/keto reductase n=1 Tax=Pyrobaculum neutrophilum (strain DSM 2338 / JCM 9278 / NBRC 100436 / V24Sta) TaxID=444157 RepID=B1Y8L5_PYRNV|nr:aldo/keto reductase [Pyrobaculum neutrophilum]ACB40094.1 aldo/keto reductase [Pyrobaculum neutrophilum V24Sta]
MRYREFCGRRVSEIGFGGWVVGSDLYPLDDDAARALVKKAVDLGINFFDTADVYGRGRSEELLGRWLAGYDVVISTKVGYDFYSGGKPERRFDPPYLEMAAARSAERLGRRPNLLMIHNPTTRQVREAAPWLRSRRGAVADCVGAALGPETDVLEQGLAALEEGLDAIMYVFNILERHPGAELTARGRGRGLLVRVPDATGVLTDRFNPAPEGHRTLRPREWLLKARAVVEREVAPLARELGLTLGQYAVKYLLSHPITTVFVTATTPDELEEYAAASDGKPLPPDHLERLASIHLPN